MHFCASRQYAGLACNLSLVSDRIRTIRCKVEFAGMSVLRSLIFALWKDADAGIPILKQARAEYLRLD